MDTENLAIKLFFTIFFVVVLAAVVIAGRFHKIDADWRRAQTEACIEKGAAYIDTFTIRGCFYTEPTDQ